MSYKITLQPDQREFAADPGSSILESALAAGIDLPYGCRHGACGACKGQVRAGQVDPGPVQEGTLTPDEIDSGHILMCCARPRSDLSVHLPHRADEPALFPVKKFPVRVEGLDRLAPDVMVMRLKLPAHETLEYRAGQFIEFILKDGSRRAYSMANAPGEQPGFLELHLRAVPGGAFTGAVFSSLKVRDILRMDGPHGHFYWRDDPKPAILLAGGTGFAPIKALVEHALRTGSTRPLHLYWGAQNRAGLYLDRLAQEWSQRYAHIRYTPVLSAALACDAWTGRCGLVHHAVLDDLADLSGYQVYACGGTALVEAARRDFRARGLSPDDFFADNFGAGSSIPADLSGHPADPR
jgi:CDP-4-dehydro-6-deoxyglucose reductase